MCVPHPLVEGCESGVVESITDPNDMYGYTCISKTNFALKHLNSFILTHQLLLRHNGTNANMHSCVVKVG